MTFELRHVEYPPAGSASYATLLRRAHRSGRCPFWIGPRGTRALWERDERPGEVVARIERADPAAILEDWWPGPCPMGCGCRDPFDAGFPGLLEPGPEGGPGRAEATRSAVDLAGELPDRCTLAVAETSRPADVPAVVGWAGAGNYPHQERTDLCAVLRSWEDRFGATLVLVTEAVLVLSVAEPPRTERDGERVAAEHFAFCPDQQDPQDGTEWDLRRYARSILGAGLWRFWWD